VSGAGRHYEGTRGARYFAWQREVGELGAELNRFKFEDHVRPTDDLVDFGCGGGALLERMTAGSKVGVEPAPAAREEAAARGLRVVAAATELREEDADVVISNHALEHSLAPLAELREVLRALRPGGRLVIWLPLDDWRAPQRAPREDRDHHLYAWTPLLLRNLLREAGFEVREVRVVAHAWPPAAARLARLPRPVFDALARAWSVLRRRRQLAAVAVRPAQG